jgi:hypothetical protein
VLGENESAGKQKISRGGQRRWDVALHSDSVSLGGFTLQQGYLRAFCYGVQIHKRMDQSDRCHEP